jgi:manganese/zinc/iron transport system substrate-binding protein
MRALVTFLGSLLALSLLAGCAASPVSSSAQDIASRQVRAVATTGMIADIVKNIGGERVQVTSLMGPGVDPHLYKASEGDVQSLGEADVIFYNGLHLEAGMARVLERMQDYRRTAAVTDSIDRNILFSPPEFQGAYDPHVWFDVSLWIQAAESVRDTLSELDPSSADLYRRNADAYLEELRALDEYVRAQAERVPESQRVLITAHDAFNYFGRAYGFQVRGLQGISTASEASTGDVAQLADFIAERRIPAIFIESSVPRRNVEAVQAAVRARGFDVRIGGSLYSDAMGDPGTQDGTYIGMVTHNIDTIVNALLGE